MTLDSHHSYQLVRNKSYFLKYLENHVFYTCALDGTEREYEREFFFKNVYNSEDMFMKQRVRSHNTMLSYQTSLGAMVPVLGIPVY